MRQRNIATSVLGGESSAAALFEAALAGGGPASGQPTGGLVPGQRADFVTLDPTCPALLGIPSAYLLDALVFSSPAAALVDVFVEGQLTSPEAVKAHAGNFSQAMRQLWRV